jgi:peptidoglycan hydrolase-like protein with peptidoglycan-binding domain
MPSTLRAFATLAGCAAVTAATLVAGAAPVTAAPPAAIGAFTPSHGVVGTAVTIAETGFTAGPATVTFGAGTATGTVGASSISVKVPSGATTSKLVVTQSGLSASSGTKKFTVDPTAARTRLGLTLSKHKVTFPGKVKVKAVATSGGHPVKGLTVLLQHRVHGTTSWHHVGGTTPQRTSSSGVASWSVKPTTRGAFRAFSTATKHFAKAISLASLIGVRPAVHLSIPSSTDVLLPVTATGHVSPKLSGRMVLERRLHHRWHAVKRPHVHHGKFHFTFRPSLPGSEKFRVVRPRDARHLGAASPAVATHVTAPTLRLGSSGPVVAALQRRMHRLHYDIGTRDGSYGWDAEHAVTAFEKVQGMSRDGVAGPAVFKALADPKKPHLQHRITSGTAVEVNLEKQVLLISKNGKLWRILDTSTGGGYLFAGSNGESERAVTPRGHFSVVYKVNALVHARLGTLNRPSFFNFNGYAIHGEGNGNDGGEVPPFPNSHGCVRITDNAVNRYYNLLAVGTSVWIY